MAGKPGTTRKASWLTSPVMVAVVHELGMLARALLNLWLE
jgi:hypothetical protein